MKRAITNKVVSILLAGMIIIGNIDVTAKASDGSLDSSSLEISVDDEDIVTSSASLNSTEGSSDVLIFEDADKEIEASAGAGTGESLDEASSDESSDEASLLSSDESSDEASLLSSDESSDETSLLSSDELPDEDILIISDDLDAATLSSSDDLPENFYTEYPVGGFLFSESTEDIQSVSDGRIRLFRSRGVPESKYTTPNLPPLRNQNPYGACWAFATLALAEISLMNNGSGASDPDLSEAHLAYFTYNTETDPLGGTEGDVTHVNETTLLNFGGRFDWGLNTLARWIGAADEATADYDEAGPLNEGGKLNSELAYADVAHVANYYVEPIEKNESEIAASLHSNLKEMISRYGAIGIDFFAFNSMKAAYDSSTYNTDTNAYYNPNSSDSNHAVVIVGWDDNFSKDKFATTPPGDGAFLVRNSWMDGTDPDLEKEEQNNYAGYFWMSYYEKTLGSYAYAATFEPASVYDNNYEYDGGTKHGAIYADKVANVFTAHAQDGNYSEKIDAVAFYTPESNVDYTIDVYMDLSDPDDPESGAKIASESGRTEYAGYHTINLWEGAVIKTGTLFSVVVSLKKNGNIAGIGTEVKFSYGSVSIESGQSYYCNDGNWLDKNDYYSDGNISIKAFTTNSEAQEDTEIEAIQISNLDEDNSIKVAAGDAIKAIAVVSPASASTNSISWSSSDEEIANVSANGVIRGIKTGEAIITALANSGVRTEFTVKVVEKLLKIDISSDIEDETVVGNTYHFTAHAVPESYEPAGEAVWSTTTPNRVEVDSQAGTYTVLKPGCWNMTVTWEGVTNSISYYAYPSENDYGYQLNGDNSVVLWWNGTSDATYYQINNGYSDPIQINANNGDERYEYVDTTFVDDSVITQTDYTIGYSIDGLLFEITFTVPLGLIYSIEYELNGGIQNPDNPVKYRAGHGIALLPPTHHYKGYIFDGWYKDAGFKTKKNTITDKDKGKIKVYAKFNRTNISTAEIEGFEDTKEYIGSPQRQDAATLYVTIDGVRTELEENVDYTATYSADITNIGTKTVTYKGINGFTGSFSKSYKVVQSIDAVGMTLDAADKVFALKGGNYVTSFTIKNDQNNKLRAGVDYDKNAVYSYAQDCYLFDGSFRAVGDEALPSDIAPVGTLMQVTAKGTGFYSGKITGVFQITEADLSKATVTVGKIYLNDQNEATLDHSQLVVKIGNKVLGSDDYEFTSSGSEKGTVADDGSSVVYSAKGTYKAVITGKGIYGGSKTISVTVSANPVKTGYVVFASNAATTGTMGSIRISNKDIILSAKNNKFVRRGYSFVKWSTAPDGDGPLDDILGDDNEQMISKDQITEDLRKTGLVLYAQWEPEEYTITYHHNGVPSDDHFGNVTSFNVETDSFRINSPDQGVWPTGYQFGGWYTDTSYKNRISEVRKGSSGDLDLNAKWIPYTYTVHFDGNGADGSMADEVFSYGVKKALLPNAFKTPKGKVFMGWSTDENADYNEVQYVNKEAVSYIIDAKNDIDGEIKLYAIWASVFEISYDMNGGEFQETAVDKYDLDVSGDHAVGTYTYNTATTLPVAITRNGYVFGGWFTYTMDDEGNITYIKQIKSIARTSTGDIDVIAKWSPYAYTITYAGNRATSGKMAVQKGWYGSVLNLSANSFVRKGYAFEGWSTNKNYAADHEGSLYEDGKEFDFVPSKNNDKVTLYAIWSEPLTYGITYVDITDKDNEKELGEDTYTYGQGLTSLLVPNQEKAGFKFIGWYSDPDFKKKVTSIAKTVAGDMTLYARYDMTQNYEVVFEPNYEGFDGSRTTQSIKYTVNTALVKNKYKYTDPDTGVKYTFMGWAISQEDANNGSVEYKDGQKILRPDADLLTENNGKYTLILYAVWKNIFEISYEPNDGILPDNGYATKYGLGISDQKILLNGTVGPDGEVVTNGMPIPVKAGYSFAGWYLDPKFRTKVTAIDPKSTSGDKTLYAKWTGIKYNVVFKANEPEEVKPLKAMKNQALVYGTAKALTKNTYKIAGYKFIGWATSQEDADNGSVEYKDGQKILRPDADLMAEDNGKYTFTLYAVWEKIVYDIKYVNVNDAYVSENISSYTVTDHLVFGKEARQSDSDVVINEPDRVGDTFLGWYSDAKFKKKVNSIKVGETGDKTFYAKWAATQYTIKYDLNEGAKSVSKANLDTSNVGYVTSYDLSYDSGYRLATATRAGYTFGGWYKDAKLKTKIGPIISSPNVDITVYAKWIPKAETGTYSIHFEPNGNAVTGSMKDMTNLKTGTVYKLTSVGFKKKYYSFAGWNVQADGNGRSFSNAEQIRDLNLLDEDLYGLADEYQSGRVITLYAQWEPITYTITYNLNRGHFEGEYATTYTYGDTIELPIPVRPNYDFVGWYEDSRFTASKKIESITSTTNGNKKLYARWVIKAYSKLELPDEYLDVTDYGVTPNDGEDDKNAIRRVTTLAQNNSKNGGVSTVYFPAGTYNYWPDHEYDSFIELWEGGIELIFDDNAIIRVGGNDIKEYSAIAIKNAENVIISGGKIDGGRGRHGNVKGEWGHGIGLFGARNVTIVGMDIYDNWGDGVYLGTQAVRQADNSQKYMGCENVMVSDCEIHNNRRNGVSLTDADDTIIISCNIYDSHGAAPQCGIYIEPNSDSSDKVCERLTVKDTVITAYQRKDDPEYMCFMTHYNPYNLSYTTARDVQFIGCVMNGYFGNYSGVKMSFVNTTFNGTVTNLKANV